MIYSLYIPSKDADNSQCDLMCYPYEDLLYFSRMMTGIVYIYKYLFPLFNVFYKHYVSNASEKDNLPKNIFLPSDRTYLTPIPVLSFK